MKLSKIESSEEERQNYYAQLRSQHVTPAWIAGGTTVGADDLARRSMKALDLYREEAKR